MEENEVKNSMKQLAKSIGVELGQEVMLIIGGSKEPIKCRILEDRIEGYYEFPGTKGEWHTIVGISSSQENGRDSHGRGKDINLIAIKSLIEYIDNRDIAEGGIFLDDDNAEFVADILRHHYKALTSENKMKQVAKLLFNKELGEEFEIVWRDIVFVVKITEDGLMADCPSGSWDSIFVGLLTGEAVVAKN